MYEHDYHGPHDHADYNDSESCQACVLAYCKTCTGGEASLPTHCPGRKLTDAEERAIAHGTLDYRHGKWWKAEDYKEPEHKAEDGSIRKNHYGTGRQPWDIIKENGWAAPFAAGNVLKYLRRTKEVADSREKARWYMGQLVSMGREDQGARAIYQNLWEILTEDERKIVD